jgi:hypothetical protein
MDEMSEQLQEDTLRRVNDNLRKALAFIRDNPRGLDKYGLMDHANQALRENKPEPEEPHERR